MSGAEAKTGTALTLNQPVSMEMTMSRDRNKVFLVGNLGDHPEIRTTPGGARVAQLSLCTTRRWNDRQGEPQEKKNWHRVEVWDSMKGTFGFVERFLGKGDRIDVEGEIDYHSYQDKDGVTRWATVIKAIEIRPAGELSGPQARGRGKSGGERSETRVPAGVAAGGGDYADFQAPPFEDEDDLPF